MSPANPVILHSKNRHFRAWVDLNGGMLSRLCFFPHAAADAAASAVSTTVQGIDILYRAPWLSDDYFSLPPNLEQHLAGEFACVPFGWVSQDNALLRTTTSHGLPCYGKWEVEAVSEAQDEVVLRFTFPDDYPLKHVVRAIALGEEGVRWELTVVARQKCSFPLGLHPIFPLGGAENELHLEIAGETLVYPQDCEPEVSRLVCGAEGVNLAHLPLKAEYQGRDGNGEYANGTHLPWPYDTEEIVQMLKPQGRALLTYPRKGVKLTLLWDKEKLPCCLLWISNRGRQHVPWCGRNCALGIEPIASAWDMADLSLLDDNPVRQRGIKTNVTLQPDVPFNVHYELTVQALR